MKIANMLSRKNRILLRELVVTDFKLRYQGSAIGYMWSLLKPLFMFTILYFVFGKILRIGGDIPHYAVYLLLGIVLWTFFSEATMNGLNAIVGRGDLIRKINFPKYIIVISGTVSALINLAFNMVVMIMFIKINGVELSWHALWILPLIIELYVFALAIAFFLSALNVKYRDTGYIWDIVMQAAFYATPIIYPVSLLIAMSATVGKLVMMVPTTQIIQDARYFLITTETLTPSTLFSSWKFVAVPFVIVAVLLLLGALYFRKNSKYFAENV